MHIPKCPALGLALAIAILTRLAAAQPPSLPLVPWPKSVAVGQGALALGSQSRIVCESPALLPLGRVLAEEIHAVAGLDLATGGGQPGPGDIGLALDPTLAKERYKFVAGENATVQGGNYGAVALGTVTLLQALTAKDGAVTIPRLSIADEPAAAFRGLLIDVARKFHSIECLKQIVTLCRLYKVRYLQLHLTDDQSFMFPSKAYPLLATKNEHGGKTYTLEQLKELVAYADARNVTIIPELEVPGHAAAVNRAMHDLFIIRGTKPYEHHASINFVKEDVLRAVETIVGEMCEVFRSSPYFHIGGDEADLALAGQNADFKAAMKKYNLPNQHELYRRFLGQMDEIVKKNGKQTILWEGFGPHGAVPIPKDILVMSYEIRFYLPQDLVKDGYQVVNASWTPLYVVNSNCRPPAEIYDWDLYRFKPYGAKAADPGIHVPAGDKVIGAEMCAWEQPEELELPNERKRLPAMMERIWNPAAGKSYADFERRWAAADRLLDLLVRRTDWQSVLRPKARARYTSFNGEQVERYVWLGRHVAFQTVRQDLDPAAMARLCDTFDKVYEFYHDATQREPAPLRQYEGRVTIAEIEKTCGAGCGYLGATGIELMPGCFRELYEGLLKHGEIDQALPYEFGRNFWFYGPQLAYREGADAGSVVTGYAVFMRFLALDAAGAKLGPFGHRSGKEFRREVERLVDLYVADPALNWENTLQRGAAPANPMGLGGTDLFASFCFRLCRDNGGSKYAARLWQAAGKRPVAKTTQEAIDNFVVAASVAAGKDLAPLFSKTWRWPVSAAAKAETAPLGLGKP